MASKLPSTTKAPASAPEGPVTRPRGHFTRPVNGDRLWRKFADCAGEVLEPTEAQALFDSLQSLPRLSSVADLGLLPVSRAAVN